MNTRFTVAKASVRSAAWRPARNIARFIAAVTLMAAASWSAAAPVLILPTSPSVGEDVSTTLSIGVTDGVTPIFTVQTTASSSNTNLISNASLAFNGVGTNRSLAIRPGLHLSGTTTITVVASDSTPSSTTNSFVLTVTATNYPPVFVQTIANQSENENSPVTNCSFIISDIETAASSLTMAGTSTNTSLLPNANITFTGTGTNRTLRFTPATNQSGQTLVSVVVTDGGGATATNSFVLTVNFVNQPPTFTMSTNRLVYYENSGLVTNAGFVSDVSSGPSNQSSESNYFVLYYSSNFFAQAPSLDTNGNLSFQTATNLSGTNVITIVLFNSGSLTNGGRNSLTNTVTLEVPFVNQPPSFALSTNLLLVSEEAPLTTNYFFLTNLLAGPPNQSSETWGFVTTTVTNNDTNAQFSTMPIVFTHGSLAFQPAAHSYGTNTVTVVMTNSG